jgi:hypothetical protein
LLFFASRARTAAHTVGRVSRRRTRRCKHVGVADAAVGSTSYGQTFSLMKHTLFGTKPFGWSGSRISATTHPIRVIDPASDASRADEQLGVCMWGSSRPRSGRRPMVDHFSPTSGRDQVERARSQRVLLGSAQAAPPYTRLAQTNKTV